MNAFEEKKTSCGYNVVGVVINGKRMRWGCKGERLVLWEGVSKSIRLYSKFGIQRDVIVQRLEIVVLFAFVKAHSSCCVENGTGGGLGGSRETNQRFLQC